MKRNNTEHQKFKRGKHVWLIVRQLPMKAGNLAVAIPINNHKRLPLLTENNFQTPLPSFIWPPVYWYLGYLSDPPTLDSHLMVAIKWFSYNLTSSTFMVAANSSAFGCERSSEKNLNLENISWYEYISDFIKNLACITAHATLLIASAVSVVLKSKLTASSGTNLPISCIISKYIVQKRLNSCGKMSSLCHFYQHCKSILIVDVMRVIVPVRSKLNSAFDTYCLLIKDAKSLFLSSLFFSKI